MVKPTLAVAIAEESFLPFVGVRGVYNVVSTNRADLTGSGVTGYFAPQEVWHPHAIFPRKIGTPSGNLAPPVVVVF